MNSGIYVWKLNGVPKYVGQGRNVKTRMFQNHRHSMVLRRAIEKYGHRAFEKTVLEYCDLEKLNELEIYYIKELHTHVSENGYNLSWGGNSPMLGLKLSEEAKRKVSIARKGKRLSEEHKKKISEAQKGKTYSEEARRKMSEARKGKKQSEEARRKNSESHKGKKYKTVGKRHSEETKKKPSKFQSGINHPQFGTKTKNATSKYFGVNHTKENKWQVRIQIDKKLKYVGVYRSEIEAASAYNNYVISNGLPHPLNQISPVA